MMKALILVAGLLAALSAQESAVRPSGVVEDSLPSPDSLTADTSAAPAEQSSQRRTKNFRTAMLLSALIPGGGQFYNESYIKGILIAGGEMTLGYFTVREHLRMVQAEREAASDSSLEARADTLRDRRNTLIFFTAAVIAFSVADAYVDAHMFGFRDAQRLSIVPSRSGLGLAVRYRF